MKKRKAESPRKESIGLSYSLVTDLKLKNQLGIFIAIFSFALYAQSISFEYAHDDGSVIANNSIVQKGFSGIPILLTTDRLLGYNNETFRVPTYRPVPLILLAIEWQLFPNSPHFYHLINVLLYSLTCWLLFILLCKLFENLNLIFPFVCTLLYATHPIHTEVVDNIKSQDEILCFLFAIASIYLFIKGEENKSVIKTVWAIIFFSLSFFSKETGISYLIIIPLTLFVFSKTKPKKILFITFVLTVITGVFLFIHTKIVNAIPQSMVDVSHHVDFNSLRAAPDLISEKATAFYILLKYILLLVFPYWLSYGYGYAQIPIQQLSSPGALLGVISYLAIGIYAVLKIRKKDPVAYAIIFYLITLAPVSNIFLLINGTMAERSLFMPSLGFCMVLTFLLIKLIKTEINKQRFADLKQFYSHNSAIFIVLFIIAGLYSARTIARNPDWKNDVALNSHDVNVVPNSMWARFGYGTVLLYNLYPQEKNNEKKKDILHKAIAEFTKAISIYPDFPRAYANIATAYIVLGDYEKAITNYEMAIRLFYPKAPSSVYCDLGQVYSQTNQYDKALSILDSSLKYYPDYTVAYINKSYAYLMEGKNREAIAECDKLLKLDPTNINGYINKGYGYLNLKQNADAITYLNKALSFDSMNVTCLKALGMTYQNIGDTITAAKYFQRANDVNRNQFSR